MTYQPKEEQEVIIRYDRQLNEWHYYGDVPALNKKWRQHVIPEKEIIEVTGAITLLSGKVIGKVSIRKERICNMTEEQKKVASQRMKLLNDSKIEF